MIPTLHNLYDTYGDMISGQYGFKDAFNGLSRGSFNCVTPVPLDGGFVAPVTVEQNVPDPCHGVTTVRFRLSEASPVTLKMYDVRGRCVRTVSDQFSDKGLGQLELDAGALPSGLYLYSVEANGHRDWKRCIVVQ